MKKIILSGLLTGLLFALMDALINANPFAVELMQVYKPISRQSLNVYLGLGADLMYGLVISYVYSLLKTALPAGSGLVKGLWYGLGIWFFRVLMAAVSNWIMFEIPAGTVIYLLISGLFEMLILGMLTGLMHKNGAGTVQELN